VSRSIHNLVWIDLEMTGLDPLGEVILEIASVVTNDSLETIAEGPTIAIKHPEELIKGMNAWCTGIHTSSGLVSRVLSSTTTLQEAEQQTLDFLQEYCYEKKSPLCGNSVWMDRFFLKIHMPKVYDFLYYRTVDVTTIKVLLNRWYPSDPQISFKKKNAHRALDDIYESIEELKYYRKHFFKNSYPSF